MSDYVKNVSNYTMNLNGKQPQLMLCGHHPIRVDHVGFPKVDGMKIMSFSSYITHTGTYELKKKRNDPCRMRAMTNGAIALSFHFSIH